MAKWKCKEGGEQYGDHDVPSDRWCKDHECAIEAVDKNRAVPPPADRADGPTDRSRGAGAGTGRRKA